MSFFSFRHIWYQNMFNRFCVTLFSFRKARSNDDRPYIPSPSFISMYWGKSGTRRPWDVNNSVNDFHSAVAASSASGDRLRASANISGYFHLRPAKVYPICGRRISTKNRFSLECRNICDHSVDDDLSCSMRLSSPWNNSTWSRFNVSFGGGLHRDSSIDIADNLSGTVDTSSQSMILIALVPFKDDLPNVAVFIDQNIGQSQIPIMQNKWLITKFSENPRQQEHLV